MWRLAMANTLNPNKSEKKLKNSPNKEKHILPLFFWAYH